MSYEVREISGVEDEAEEVEEVEESESEREGEGEEEEEDGDRHIIFFILYISHQLTYSYSDHSSYSNRQSSRCQSRNIKSSGKRFVCI